jgi:nitrite reductase (NO-forming)
LRGLQTVLLGASAGAIVEFVVPEKGEYIMVDHHFANAALGAVGVINASDGATTLMAGGHPHPEAITDPDAEKGKVVYEARCVMCHTVGGGDKIGPDLRGVTQRRADAWLTKWLLETDSMLKTDPAAKQLLEKYKTSMPNPSLSPAEANQLVKFFHWNDRHDGPAKK